MFIADLVWRNCSPSQRYHGCGFSWFHWVKGSSVFYQSCSHSGDQVVKLLQVLHLCFVISESSGLFCIAKGFLLTCHDLWRPENDAMKNSPLWVSINPGGCHVWNIFLVSSPVAKCCNASGLVIRSLIANPQQSTRILLSQDGIFHWSEKHCKWQVSCEWLDATTVRWWFEM